MRSSIVSFNRMHQLRLGRLSGVAALAALAALGCRHRDRGGKGNITEPPPPPPNAARLEVTVATTGDDLDGDGYRITLEGHGTRTVAANGRVVFDTLTQGVYRITVTGVAGNCALEGESERTIPVAVKEASYTVRVGCLRRDRIAFVSTRDGNPEIYVIFPDGTGLQRLTSTPQMESDPDWSPDGKQIAFVSRPAGGGMGRIYIMNADGTGRRLLAVDASREDAYPAWSPDGRTIAFSRDNGSGHDIYLVPAAGGTPVRVTAVAAEEYRPSWSPDGSQLIFDVQRPIPSGYVFELYAMHVDGSGRVKLALPDTLPFNFGARWSPDGTRVTFEGELEDNHEVFVADADGSNVRRLTTSAANDGNPCWSPDGTRIVFSSLRDYDHDIYIMNADGTGVRRLTTDGVNYDAVWR